MRYYNQENTMWILGAVKIQNLLSGFFKGPFRVVYSYISLSVQNVLFPGSTVLSTELITLL